MEIVELGVPTEVLGDLILQEERPEESFQQGQKGHADFGARAFDRVELMTCSSSLADSTSPSS
jgi:hypothetical protein